MFSLEQLFYRKESLGAPDLIFWLPSAAPGITRYNIVFALSFLKKRRNKSKKNITVFFLFSHICKIIVNKKKNK